MKRAYTKPEARLVAFNYEKVMAASCVQGSWQGHEDIGEACDVFIPDFQVHSKARSGCGSSGGHPYD